MLYQEAEELRCLPPHPQTLPLAIETRSSAWPLTSFGVRPNLFISRDLGFLGCQTGTIRVRKHDATLSIKLKETIAVSISCGGWCIDKSPVLMIARKQRKADSTPPASAPTKAKTKRRKPLLYLLETRSFSFSEASRSLFGSLSG